MRIKRLLLSSVLSAAVAAVPVSAAAQVVEPQGDMPMINVAATPDQSGPIAAIRQAPDPSSAIDAYAKASAADRNSVAAEEAYVEKMVSFGLPEMAEAQAQDLTRKDPNNGLAWAVMAYMDAKRNQTPAALTAIVAAAKRSPADPFVQRTAAELIAWYDVRGDKAKIDASLQQSVEDMRRDLSQRQLYLDSYARAKAEYQQQVANQTNETTPPSTPGSEGIQPGVQGSVTPDMTAGAYDTYYSAPVYTDPYVYALYPDYGYAYPYYAYWYPSVAYSDYWWWPTFGFGFSDFDFHHHHFDRDDSFHHDRFDRDGFAHRGSFDKGHFGRFGGRDFGTRGNSGHRLGPRVSSNLGEHRIAGPRVNVPRADTVRPKYLSQMPRSVAPRATSPRIYSSAPRSFAPHYSAPHYSIPHYSAPHFAAPRSYGDGMHSFGGGFRGTGGFHGGGRR